MLVLEISAGAAQHCSARQEPIKPGKVTMRFQPKVTCLLISALVSLSRSFIVLF